MVLVAYEYVGDDFYDDYHYDCDWQTFRDDIDAKHAIFHFWNTETMDGDIKSNHRKDFVIKEVIIGEDAVEKYKEHYWEHEPDIQCEPASERDYA